MARFRGLLGHSSLKAGVVAHAARLVAEHVEGPPNALEGALRSLRPALVGVQAERQLAVGALHTLSTNIPRNVQYLNSESAILNDKRR